MTRSAAANDVIPVTAVVWAKTISALNAVVTAVPDIGDCITLSILRIALEFSLVAVIWCEVPIPTEVTVNTSGFFFNAFSADSANLNPSSPNLTTNNSCGNLSVVPIPATTVSSIPTALTLPAPWKL